MRKRPMGLRLSVWGQAIVRALKDDLGISGASVIEQAIRDFGRRRLSPERYQEVRRQVEEAERKTKGAG